MRHLMLSPCRKMKNTAGVFFLFIALVMDYTCAQFSKRFEFEAENGTSNGRTRNNVVYLESNEHVENTFRIHSSCSVSVSNVFYYSDGSSSGSVAVTLDGKTVGSFVIELPEADDSPANLWNIQYRSRAVGTKQLPPGSHYLTLTVNYIGCRGVEIDKTILSFICDQDPSEEGGTPQTDEAGGTPQTDSVSTPESGWSDAQIIAISLSVPGAIAAICTIIGAVCGYKKYQKRNASANNNANKASGRIVNCCACVTGKVTATTKAN